MIAIIGGGPAGIALAAALDRQRMPYVLLEARTLGSTWRQVPHDLTVLSPWWTNILDLRGLVEGLPLSKAPAGRYVAHLERVASRLRGTIRTGTRAVGLRRLDDGRWQVDTTPSDAAGAQPLIVEKVVVCTGYFDRPALPRPAFSDDGSIPVIHSRDIGSFDALRTFGDPALPLLVVGKRVTAGQLLLKLASFGRRMELSAPSTVAFRRHGAIAWLREMAYYVWESAQLAIKPHLKRDSFPPMEGGRCREMVESGAVAVRPSAVAVREGRVHFTDGTSARYGGVVLATGYSPQLELVQRALGAAPESSSLPERHAPGFEVVELPGVHLLGFDNLRNHRSRYLRGIRDDARVLARQLKRDSIASG